MARFLNLVRTLRRRPLRRRRGLERGPHKPVAKPSFKNDHSFKEYFGSGSLEDTSQQFNKMELDINLKKAALHASKATVSIMLQQPGGETFVAASGIILESSCGEAIILTSSVVIADPKNIFEIHIRLSDGTSYKGRVLGSDPYYNLAALKIEPDALLPASLVRPVDDSLAADDDLQQRSSSSVYFNLTCGETLMAIGRHWKSPYNLMSSGGLFSAGRCYLHCEELCRLDCRISKSGIGGPVVNSHGEVIGISFYARRFTPFLPINFALKWWDQWKTNTVFRRPNLGIRVANLFTANANILEKILVAFPVLSKGVIVEKVREGSSAAVLGIRPHDVIIRCSEHVVLGFLQFHEMLADKTGEEVVLSVLRPSRGSLLNLDVTIPSA